LAVGLVLPCAAAEIARASEICHRSGCRTLWRCAGSLANAGVPDERVSGGLMTRKPFSITCPMLTRCSGCCLNSSARSRDQSDASASHFRLCKYGARPSRRSRDPLAKVRQASPNCRARSSIPRCPMPTSRTRAKSRSLAMSSVSKCWMSTRNAVGSR